MKEYTDYSLLSHNTFGIDARCRRFVVCETVDDARLLARRPAEGERPLLIIGGGSNLLLTGHYDGTVVRSDIRGIEVVSETDGDVLLRVGSGEEWDRLVGYCVDHDWYGIENLSLIPGDVGASAVQNIGAYGVEASSVIDSIEAVRLGDGQTEVIAARDCDYGYRQSRFKQEWRGRYLITHVVYRLQKTFRPRLDYGNIRDELVRRDIAQPTARQLREVIIAIRRAKLPDHHVEGNAGSFFVNPVVSHEQFETLIARYPKMPHYHAGDGREKIPAGWLIEQCGWKGRTVGHAGVHANQALVLVNRGGATGGEILHLCERICRDVKRRFDIEIRPEVNIV